MAALFRCGVGGLAVLMHRFPNSLRLALLAGILVCAGEQTALAGEEKHVVVERFLLDGRDGDARKKCRKWDADLPAAPMPLREVCAKAYWPVVEKENTHLAWYEYRKTWAQTELGMEALEREATVVLGIVAVSGTETELLEHAETYNGTVAAPTFLHLAADAAMAEAKTPGTAVLAARKYPEHRQLPELVERFPEAFVKVTGQAGAIRVTLEPAVTLPTEKQPRIEWRVRNPDGSTANWDESTQNFLLEWGIPQTFLDKLPSREGSARFPVCFAPGRNPGLRPAVAVHIGTGSTEVDVDWEKGCGTEAWPVFMTVKGKRVMALSANPDHRVDLDIPDPIKTTDSTGDDASSDDSLLVTTTKDTRHHIQRTFDPAILFDGALYRRAGTGWLAFPVTGTAPWATTRAPGEMQIVMDDRLQGAGMPQGWKVETGDGELVPKKELAVITPETAGVTEPWGLINGEIRTLSPLVQRTLGLDLATTKIRPAPRLTDQTPWIRAGRHSIARKPPLGGQPAALYAMEPDSVEVAIAVLKGLNLKNITILDGWQSDLDSDGVKESVLRGFMGGAAATWVIDPIDGDDPSTRPRADNARVMILTSRGASSSGRTSETPFSFRLRGHTYLAWSSLENERARITVVRFDGAGFAIDDFGLP